MASNEIYVVTAATGNIGKELTLALLKAGKRVRAIGRSAERLQSLVDKGAEAAVGSVDDAAFLTEAFAGAKSVFALIPPNHEAENFRAYQHEVADAIVAAIRAAGVTHVVHLSSIGAHLPSGTGPIAGLHDAEQRLNAVEGLDVVHLRPTFFLENLLNDIGTIKALGVDGSALRPDVSIPMIATKDIAAVAAEYMLAGDFTGSSVRELYGARDYTPTEAAAALGKAIGKPDLQYVQFPYDDARAALLAVGLSPSVVDDYIEMYTAMNEGTLWLEVERSAVNTTPTTIEEFAAEVFAPAYASAAAAGA
jgi:uncharacterized protein YbjT (DUF2867 family)